MSSTTIYFSHTQSCMIGDDGDIEFYDNPIAAVCGASAMGNARDAYVYTHDGHSRFPATEEGIEEHITECKDNQNQVIDVLYKREEQLERKTKIITRLRDSLYDARKSGSNQADYCRDLEIENKKLTASGDRMNRRLKRAQKCLNFDATDNDMAYLLYSDEEDEDEDDREKKIKTYAFQSKWILEKNKIEIEELSENFEKLKQNNKGLTILKQEAEQRSFCYEAENKKLKEELVERDGLAHAFCDTAAILREENEKLKAEVQYQKETAEVGVGLANSIKEENELLLRTRDEFVKVFVDIGELVENTNLPRIGEQLVIEFRKLQDENWRLQEEQVKN